MASTTIRDHASSYWLGVLVISLYVLFVACVTFGFGSYIYRTSWQAEGIAVSSGDGRAATAADIDNMLFILKREQRLEELRDAVGLQISQLERDHAAKQSEIRQSWAAIARVRDERTLQADFVLTDLEQFSYALPGHSRLKYERVIEDSAIDSHLKIQSLFEVLDVGFANGDVDSATLARFNDTRTRTEELLVALSSAVEAANKASHDLQAERDLIQERIEQHKGKREEHRLSIVELQKTLPVGSTERARLSALSLNLPFSPDILMRLVSFPTIFLTLIVTIAAGGLGTVVAFSRRYYSSTDPEGLTPSRLFVNVGEGIAAAIAIFLFSGAGMLAFTQGGGPANEVELSPYTVAFIAFLSGFMAEDAFASIQSAGKRIFKTDEPPAAAEAPKPGADGNGG
ncbi:MAG: hypothetical protein AB3N17_18015 [Tateyamaria sp.]